jgi:hypothetical protein
LVSPPLISHRRRDCAPARFQNVALATAATLLAAVSLRAEIVFQDTFVQPAGNVTNSVPWLDVQGTGWRSGASSAGLQTDGAGHLYNPSAAAPSRSTTFPTRTSLETISGPR